MLHIRNDLTYDVQVFTLNVILAQCRDLAKHYYHDETFVCTFISIKFPQSTYMYLQLYCTFYNPTFVLYVFMYLGCTSCTVYVGRGVYNKYIDPWRLVGRSGTV